MVRVPTLCVLGDFNDQIRDQYFINQYEKDGVMKVYRLNSLENEKDQVIEFINKSIV
jgi:hypothetical protein